MSVLEVFWAIFSVLAVVAGAAWIVISRNRQAKREQEMREMLGRPSDGKVELDSLRQARKRGPFGKARS